MKKKLKVLWVTNALGCGGAERQMLYMYEIAQKYCNFDITILYYAKVGDALNIDNVQNVFIDKSKVGKVHTIIEINRYIRENNIDIVHAFGGSSANLYGRMAAIFTKAVPVGAMLGKRHFVRKPFAMINSFLNLFGNWWTVNNAELIPILRNDLLFISQKRVKLIHNGFAPASEVDYQINSMTEYDLDKKDQFVFAVIGRLQPVKNYPLFLVAAKKITQKYKNIRFWIIGNGDELNSLKKLADEYKLNDYVRFWGYRTDVDIAMSRVDVFVQTSFTEGSPNTIAEAMRAGRPVISTRSTDLSEMIINDKNGYEIPIDDCEALTEAMEKMIQKPETVRKAMGEESQRMFMETFLDKKVACEFQEFYTEVLKNRKDEFDV